MKNTYLLCPCTPFYVHKDKRKVLYNVKYSSTFFNISFGWVVEKGACSRFAFLLSAKDSEDKRLCVVFLELSAFATH